MNEETPVSTIFGCGGFSCNSFVTPTFYDKGTTFQISLEGDKQ